MVEILEDYVIQYSLCDYLNVKTSQTCQKREILHKMKIFIKN